MPLVGRIFALLLSLPWVAAASRAQAQNDPVTLGFYEVTLLGEIALDERHIEFRRYLRGMATGFEAVLADYRNRQQKLAFCMPVNKPLDVKELRATIDWELAARGAEWSKTPELPLHHVAIEAFRRRYPCS